jgi:hypothetical protein
MSEFNDIFGNYRGVINGVKFLFNTDISTKDSGESCPPATQDIAINIKNRQKAIDAAAYGPLNPKEPDAKFWPSKAKRWNVSEEDAKKSLCGNCIMFVRSPRVLNCIDKALGNESGNSAWEIIDSGKIGYCEAFDFKCHSLRTCDAWVVGGPTVTDKPIEKGKEKE